MRNRTLWTTIYLCRCQQSYTLTKREQLIATSLWGNAYEHETHSGYAWYWIMLLYEWSIHVMLMIMKNGLMVQAQWSFVWFQNLYFPTQATLPTIVVDRFLWGAYAKPIGHVYGWWSTWKAYGSFCMEIPYVMIQECLWLCDLLKDHWFSFNHFKCLSVCIYQYVYYSLASNLYHKK